MPASTTLTIRDHPHQPCSEGHAAGLAQGMHAGRLPYIIAYAIRVGHAGEET